MSNELVIYHNDLNSLSMRNWSAEEMDLFFTVIAKIRDSGTTLVRLDVDELKVLTGTETRNSYWFNMLDKFSEKAIQLRYREQTKTAKAIYNLFGSFKFNLDDRTLSVSVTNDFEYIVNKLTANFTAYELAEFTNLRSTYSKAMYRVLKQWKTLGEKEFKVEQLRELLEIPDSYDVGKINSRIIKQIQKELPVYFTNLKIKAIDKNTQGKPIIAYRFRWDKQKPSNQKWNDDEYNKKSNTKSLSDNDNRMSKAEREEYVNKKLKQKLPIKKISDDEEIENVEGQIFVEEI